MFHRRPANITASLSAWMEETMKKSTGRLTIPTDVDVVEGILRPMKLWEADTAIHRWFNRNQNVDVHAYVENGFWYAVNNTYEP